MAETRQTPITIEDAEMITIDRKTFDYMQKLLEQRRARQRAYYARNAEERKAYASAYQKAHYIHKKKKMPTLDPEPNE